VVVVAVAVRKQRIQKLETCKCLQEKRTFVSQSSMPNAHCAECGSSIRQKIPIQRGDTADMSHAHNANNHTIDAA
jgi:hypothetical protein